jgi:hypothetical protein
MYLNQNSVAQTAQRLRTLSTRHFSEIARRSHGAVCCAIPKMTFCEFIRYDPNNVKDTTTTQLTGYAAE